ncbi:Aste57867_9261 [Aphanomyces stellatus]|uniref:Aste57867_9261 protein n=1 Tax=Aphanomyces stellatus TaxID=120398 RepID=A0A485KMF5_9STRA|nr:hypothetical protein As57867_009225 [Aphanomyces stellatus]VFT86144.1 Aste57867_9261 [Aphanomyces stellatus]
MEGSVASPLRESDATETSSAWLQGIKTLHKEIMAHELAWPFMEPVDPVKLNIPTYFQIIERPMDFGTMQAKLQGSTVPDEQEDLAHVFGTASATNYTTLDEYKQDLFLVFRNAIKFNADDGREESVGNIAKRLRQHCLKLLATYFGVKSPSRCNESCLTWDEKMELSLLERQVANAKAQDLRGRWKRQSFVARMNRQKIQRRNEAAMQASP